VKIIFCPVGTSILTNGADERAKEILRDFANAVKREEMPRSEADYIDAYIKQRSDDIPRMDNDRAKKISAELHSLLILFEEESPHSDDIIYLIPTNTYFGSKSADLVQRFLSKIDLRIEVMEIPGLQTKSQYDLHRSFIRLVREIHGIFEAHRYRKSRYIFNLTGGFKAVQGFLQTLSMIYADETVYIFESESSLMRIPRLPVKLQAEQYIRDNIDLWRRLSMNLSVDEKRMGEIPSTFYYQIGDEYILSEYGELIWQNVICDVYGKKVLQPPSEKIVLCDRFLGSVANLSSDRSTKLNRQIDCLAAYLEGNRQSMLKSLGFKSIGSNAKKGSTHEFYAWSDQDAKRVFCHYDDEQRLVLDLLDDHL